MAGQYEETFLIDGYNLLLRGFTYLNGEALQAARAKLEVRLREFQRIMGPHIRIIVIFDGADMVAGEASHPDPSFQVMFTRPPRTADEAIIDSCRRLQGSGSGSIVVVSSDRKDIGRQLRGLRVRQKSSEDFAQAMDDAMQRRTGAPLSPASSGAPAAEKPSPEEISPEEVDEWMKVFSKPKERRTSPRSPGRRKRR